MGAVLAELTERKAALEERLEQVDDLMRENLHQLDGKLEQIEFAERLQRKVDSVHGAAAQLEKLEEQYEAMHCAELEANDKLHDAEQLLQQKQTLLDEILEKIDEQRAKIQNLESQLDAQHGGQRSLENKANSYDSREKEQTEMIETLTQEVEDLETRAQDAETKCTELNGRIDEIDMQMDEEKKSQCTMQDEIKMICDEVGMIL